MKIDCELFEPSLFEPRPERVHLPDRPTPHQAAFLVLDCQELFWIFCI